MPTLRELLAVASSQRKSATGETALYELIGRLVEILEPEAEPEPEAEDTNDKTPPETKEAKIAALRDRIAALRKK